MIHHCEQVSYTQKMHLHHKNRRKNKRKNRQKNNKKRIGRHSKDNLTLVTYINTRSKSNLKRVNPIKNSSKMRGIEICKINRKYNLET